MRKTVTVGITGGIGSGKTEVARIFRALGAQVYFADPIASALMEDSPGIRRRLRSLFGPAIFDKRGRLDRRRVASAVFGHPSLLQSLNAAVHPAVITYLRRELRAARRSRRPRIVAVEAALIFEARTESMFDYVIAVDAPERTRIRRLLRRGGTGRAEIRRRIASQMPARDKISRADIVIRNAGDRRALKRTCKFVYDLLAGAASSPARG